ncbi:hypothetical protein NASMSEV_051 [Candidatus Nasuia deltocephalinicola]|uniref:Uncharacterized protein n=1 Tax=Candidatus Nasuia deltocephalincola TaxID=1160784 RepID=A0A7G6UHM1_9PROT|nr:hypothetical protein NASMSEV_051 [Candidatus Nasuia deltocephalinicola]
MKNICIFINNKKKYIIKSKLKEKNKIRIGKNKFYLKNK